MEELLTTGATLKKIIKRLDAITSKLNIIDREIKHIKDNIHKKNNTIF